jgi:ABC-2 type transport system permease protein
MNSFLIAEHIFRRTIGNRKGFLMLVLLPILIISAIIGIFGHASSNKAPIVIWNEDQSWMSAPIMEAIQSVDTYEVHIHDAQETETDTLRILKEGVNDSKWGAAVHIPAGFTERLLEGKEPKVSLIRKNEQLWNAALLITLTEVTNRLVRNVHMAAESSSDKTIQESLVRQLLDQQVQVKVKVTIKGSVQPYNNALVLVMGLMLMFIMILVNQSIHGIMEDRGNRTMARMFAAPVRAWEIAVGNFLGCLLLGTLQLVLILTVTRYAIGFDFGMPLGKMLVVMELFLLSAVGIATAVAGLVRSSVSLGNINNLVVIPTCMLGGCFWPVTMMPDFMQKLSNFTPQRWAIAALEQVQSGATLTEIGVELGILLLFAAVLLAFGSSILQPAKS